MAAKSGGSLTPQVVHYVANETLNGDLYIVVQAAGDLKRVADPTTAGDKTLAGVLATEFTPNGVTSGSLVGVVVGGDYWVTVSGTVTEGDWLTTSSGGTGIVYSDAAVSGSAVIGILGRARESGTDGGNVLVHVLPHTLYKA